MISKLKFSKGNNSIKNVDGVMVLTFYTLPDGTLYLYQLSKLHENISKALKIIERTRFP